AAENPDDARARDRLAMVNQRIVALGGQTASVAPAESAPIPAPDVRAPQPEKAPPVAAPKALPPPPVAQPAQVTTPPPPAAPPAAVPVAPAPAGLSATVRAELN